MKSPHFSAGTEGPTIIQEITKKTIGEKLKSAYEAARISFATTTTKKNGIIISKNLNKTMISKEINEIKRGRSTTTTSTIDQDPIRTVMFLGSWSHT
ncbi:hypothetical protein BVC80_8955g35 [Macleaya cordata]|uniref:Uncharacterized protein n=1 Tax=Macleaya cordata TaxID=56857 RepID=A0A200QWM8_MACCD|nr:hypothetical protein BVC80_8955g35 [Macleaya cordata]